MGEEKTKGFRINNKNPHAFIADGSRNIMIDAQELARVVADYVCEEQERREISRRYFS